MSLGPAPLLCAEKGKSEPMISSPRDMGQREKQDLKTEVWKTFLSMNQSFRSCQILTDFTQVEKFDVSHGLNFLPERKRRE